MKTIVFKKIFITFGGGGIIIIYHHFFHAGLSFNFKISTQISDFHINITVIVTKDIKSTFYQVHRKFCVPKTMFCNPMRNKHQTSTKVNIVNICYILLSGLHFYIQCTYIYIRQMHRHNKFSVSSFEYLPVLVQLLITIKPYMYESTH